MWEILQDKLTPADYVDTIERGVNMEKVWAIIRPSAQLPV